MLIEGTNYYARKEQSGDVLRQRRQATAIRISLGLPPGRILVRIEGSGPDVRWECAFADRAAYEADREARSRSPEFQAAVAAMRALVEWFERRVEEVVPDQAES